MIDLHKLHARPCIYHELFSSSRLLAAPYPFIIGVDESDARQPDPLHWHDAFEIGFVLAGAGQFVVEDRSFAFQPGQVHVINGTDRHMAYAADQARFANIHFHPDLLRDMSFALLDGDARRPFALGCERFTPVLPADDPHTRHVLWLLRAIMEEHDRAAPHWPLAVKGLLLQVISLLLRYFLADDLTDAVARQRQELRARLTPALRLLEEGLDQPPPLAVLAAAVALSPSRFSALFHEAMGTSPVAYRNMRRIILAQRLLASEATPIGLIAERCGFNTVQQFNRVFQRVTGCPPSHYRQRLFAPQPPSDHAPQA